MSTKIIKCECGGSYCEECGESSDEEQEEEEDEFYYDSD